MLPLNQLVALCRPRWAVALLADLATHAGGARRVELLHRLGISRDSLSKTLEIVQQHGWAARNPGYGHPLRPEYVLTHQGWRLARTAMALVSAQADLGLPVGALTCWSMPLVRVIGQDKARFNALAQVLVPATPRAISQGLRVLTDHRLVIREVLAARPPLSLYQLTARGAHLAQAAAL